jgi:hypothetical protein
MELGEAERTTSPGMIADTTKYLEVRTREYGDECIGNFIVFGSVKAVQVRYLKLYSQFPIPERLKNKRRYPNTVSFRANCSPFFNPHIHPHIHE